VRSGGPKSSCATGVILSEAKEPWPRACPDLKPETILLTLDGDMLVARVLALKRTL
jgi:hypothetical protein